MVQLQEYQWRSSRSTPAWPPTELQFSKDTQWRARGMSTEWHWGAWDSPLLGVFGRLDISKDQMLGE
ncbi:unnamed protein product, partial [Timema podura]|nr:unnamed protein product [Timema podura]